MYLLPNVNVVMLFNIYSKHVGWCQRDVRDSASSHVEFGINYRNTAVTWSVAAADINVLLINNNN